MTETPVVPEVFAAVLAVMADVTDVPKTGVGPKTQGGYSYRKLDDTVTALGAAFREHALMVQSRVLRSDYTEYDVEGRNGVTRWNRCTLEMEYRFTSLVDGSTLVFQSIGQGLDNSDKSSNKAMSGALKYALTQAFMLATGEADPDGDAPQVSGTPVAGETTAQRTLRERRAAQGQTAAPATEEPPVNKAYVDQQTAAPAQPAGPDEATVQQTERDATVALTGAAKESANAEANNETIKVSSQQIARARKAIQVGPTIPDRFTLNRVILQCHQEGILAVTIDGKNVGAMLAAARGMLS